MLDTFEEFARMIEELEDGPFDESWVEEYCRINSMEESEEAFELMAEFHGRMAQRYEEEADRWAARGGARILKQLEDGE